MSGKLWQKSVLLFLCSHILSAGYCFAAEYLTPYTGGIQPYIKGKATVSIPAIRAGIISHHGLASGMIARFYDVLAAKNNVESIIILGPDHFKAGQRRITVSPFSWKTGNIVLENNVDLFKLLNRTQYIKAEGLPFRLEHSIGLHIDFVSHYFPYAKVTALIIKNAAALYELAPLVPILAQALDENTLLILSMDLSHKKMPDEARREDDKTLERILAFQTERLEDLDVDAARATWLFLQVLKFRGIDRGIVLERTNSSKILNRPDLPCTSYAAVVFTPPPAKGGSKQQE